MITLPARTTDPTAYDLQYRVALFLQQHRLSSGSRLRIEAHRGVITLAGQVPSFHQRQLIYSFARRVAGVVQVIDQLEVLPVEPRKKALTIGQGDSSTRLKTAGLRVPAIHPDHWSGL
jgi:osmotically-inducible protein OsmY